MNTEHYSQKQEDNFEKIVQEAILLVMNENNLDTICSARFDCDDINSSKITDITDLVTEKVLMKLRDEVSDISVTE